MKMEGLDLKVEWVTLPLGEIADIVDSLHQTPQYVSTGYPMVRVVDIKEGYLDLSRCVYVDKDTFDKFAKKYKPQKGDIVISRVGTYGTFSYVATEKPFCLGQNTAIIAPRIDSKYLYYFLTSYESKKQIEAMVVGSTQKTLSLKSIKALTIYHPKDINAQRRIVAILAALDDKISNNKKINHHLEQMAQAIFKSWFVDFELWDGVMPENWIVGKAEDFFDISIGKTPPRKEPQWFTTNPHDIIWVSISDMGSCGAFIGDSSEYLTAESIEKFNVKVIPSGTVILSFKLTVGRVAITNGEMTTNEAIAHFKRSDDITTEYLYCYLKAFNYGTLGSTSSIATAVNSKTIKAMQFIMPDDKTLQEYHTITAPLFEQIRVNLEESTRLATLRDTLLPKLMSGELSVANLAAE